jgi:hypothetical protein
LDFLDTLWKQHGLLAARPTFMDEMDYPMDGYLRKLNEEGDVVVEDGRPVEFLLDVWTDGRMSAMQNVAQTHALNTQVKRLAGRSIRHLMILPSERIAYFVLHIAGMTQPDNLFFSTVERLKKHSLPKALFAIDSLDNLVHYTDLSLRTTVHERRRAR